MATSTVLVALFAALCGLSFALPQHSQRTILESHGYAAWLISFVCSALLLGAVTAVPLSMITSEKSRAKIRTVTRSASVAAIIGVLMWAVAAYSDLQRGAQRAGQDILDGRPLPSSDTMPLWLDVTDAPAQVEALTSRDPYRVCNGRAVAYLVGHRDGVQYILLFPTSAAGQRGSLVRLPDSLYTVRTGLVAAAPCTAGNGTNATSTG